MIRDSLDGETYCVTVTSLYNLRGFNMILKAKIVLGNWPGLGS